jgi:hypothetical protein
MTFGEFWYGMISWLCEYETETRCTYLGEQRAYE